MMPKGLGRIAAVATLLALCLVAGCRTWTSDEQAAAEAFNRGNDARNSGDLQAAVEAYRTALEFQSDMAAASFNLALVQSDLGNFREAQRHLLKLRDRDPENLRIIRALAWVNRRSNNLQAALDYYEEALRIYEGDKESLRQIVDISIGMEDWLEAAARQLDLLFLEETGENRLRLGVILAADGRNEAALDEYRLYFAGGGNETPAYHEAGQIAESIDLFHEAAFYFEKAAAGGGPDAASAWFSLARIRLVNFLDYENGLDALERSLDADFSDYEALNALLQDVQNEIVGTIREMITSRESS